MRKAPIYLYFNSARIKLTAAHKAEEYPHPMLQCVFFICLQDIYLGWGDYDSYFEKFSRFFEELLVNCIMGNRTVRNCRVKISKWENYHKILSVMLKFRVCHFYIQASRKRCLTNFKSKRRLQENTISLLFELVYCAFGLE